MGVNQRSVPVILAGMVTDHCTHTCRDFKIARSHIEISSSSFLCIRLSFQTFWRPIYILRTQWGRGPIWFMQFCVWRGMDI